MEKPDLYPLQFEPILKYRLWGGEKLKNKLGKPTDQEKIGESWEISAVRGDESVVSHGPLAGVSLPDLIDRYGEQLLGENVWKTYGREFPLLIKFIDAATPLSIQVHPDDATARRKHNSYGKNEMWYIMDSDPDAEIIVGFNKPLDQESYATLVEHGDLESHMNKIAVREGDAFFIPTGRVHAIGAGVTLAEIQQSSDVTYRIYDYDRVDETTGGKRELHTLEALEVMDFTVHKDYGTSYLKTPQQNHPLIHNTYFKTDFVKITERYEDDLTALKSLVIYMCVSGSAELVYSDTSYLLETGSTIMIPACIGSLILNSTNAKLLKVYM
ncbi:MAG: type I phosphomannose isomerase catalytic subunit [Nonlabens sp.]